MMWQGQSPRPPSALLRRFSDWARYETALLGARLETIKAARGWGDAELAAALCTTLDDLVLARLCYVPKTRAQIELVAARCGLSTSALAQLLDVPAQAPGPREEGPWPAR